MCMGMGTMERGGMAIMIKVEAEYMKVGIKGIPLNAARAERAVSG